MKFFFFFLLLSTAFLQADLVGYWAFDEGSGTAVADKSSYNNNGTLERAQANTWTTGKWGNGLYFDGSTAAYVKILTSPSIQITNAISFSAWVYSTNPNRDAPILAKEYGGNLSYWFGVYNGGFGTLLSDNGSGWNANYRGSGSVPANQWTLLTTTWDGATIRNYQNGVLVGSTSYSDPSGINVSNAFLSIGINSNYDFTRFQGILDEVRIYNHALNTTEIATLQVNPVPEPACVLLLCIGFLYFFKMRH